MLSLVSKKLDANKFWTETGDTISNVLIAQAAQENKEENKIIEGLIISSYKISKKVLNSDTKIFKMLLRPTHNQVGLSKTLILFVLVEEIFKILNYIYSGI